MGPEQLRGSAVGVSCDLRAFSSSDGNTLGATFRLGVTNDSWRALTPYRGDATLNHRVPTWEGAFGGPLVKQRLFYFGAAMGARNEQSRTLPYTRRSYAYGDAERKFEIKATWTPSTAQTLKAVYFRVDSSRTNVNAGTVMDVASLYDNASPESLTGVSYNAVVRQRWLFEAAYSRRRLTFSGSGSRDASLSGGTPIWDRSRSDARFNSPTGCAVCPGAEDARNNQDLSARLSFNLAVRLPGTTEILTGVDLFQESRATNTYQSGSGFRVRATTSIVSGEQVRPVFLPDRTTWIYWQPILQGSTGNDLRTSSAFVSDTWRPSSRVTVKAGLRFDLNDDRDSLRRPAVHDAAWSPRLSVAWDPSGQARWLLPAGWARYLTSITSTVADAASPGGRPATYVYDYLGPAVNADATKAPTSSSDALRILFDWFLGGQGVKRATRSSPSIPGVNVLMDPGLGPLDTREIMGALT